MAVQVLEFLGGNTKNRPNEDCVMHVSSRVFAVGDGITRFVLGANEYPNPSIASSASTTFCRIATRCANSLIEQGQEVLFGDKIKEIVKIGFKEANSCIQEFNALHGITRETTDYLKNDFAGCVGVLGILMGSTLYYGYIGDCGLLIYNSKSFCRNL